MEKKHLTSIRLSPLGKRLLEMLAAELGISQTAVLEVCIREYARQGKARTQEGTILDVRGAFLNLASSMSTLSLAYQTLRTNAGITIDVVASEPEYAHLIPLLEQMREACLTSLDYLLDALPPEVEGLMEAAQESASDHG